jgi:hypothetical protein
MASLTDDQVEQLLDRYAAELTADELEGLIQPETRERLERCAVIQARQLRVRSRIIFTVSVMGLAAAACLVLVLYPRAAPRIDDFRVSTLRGVDRVSGDLEFDVWVTLKRPGYVRIVLIDETAQWWLTPFDQDRSSTPKDYVQRIQGTKTWTVSAQPNPKHPKAKAIFAMVIASKGEAPSAEALLKAIPDPVAPPNADTDIVRQALERIRTDLQQRFDCVVRFEPIQK